MENDLTLREAALKLGFVTEELFDRVVDPAKMVGPYLAGIEFTGLKALADAPAKSLGTPGRKRLEIARVLATEPKLLLLDEALAGLTPGEIQEAIALVRRRWTITT